MIASPEARRAAHREYMRRQRAAQRAEIARVGAAYNAVDSGACSPFCTDADIAWIFAAAARVPAQGARRASGSGDR